MKKHDKEEIKEAIGWQIDMKPHEIEEIVNKYLPIKMHQIQEKNRKRDIADARAGICILFWLSGLSQEQAEEKVGLNSHGTINNYIQRFYNDIDNDTNFITLYMKVVIFHHARDYSKLCRPTEWGGKEK